MIYLQGGKILVLLNTKILSEVYAGHNNVCCMQQIGPTRSPFGIKTKYIIYDMAGQADCRHLPKDLHKILLHLNLT